MTDLLSSARPLGGSDVVDHRADWSWLPDPADIPAGPALARARDEAERLLADHGVTYGADQEGGDHPWHLDPLPVIVDEPEWARLDAALVQRAELLDAVLQDVYGHRQLLTDKLLPPTVVVGHPGFTRAVDGLRLPGGRELVLTATDLVRDGAGAWCAVADRTQAPSGAGYALADRHLMSRAFPRLLQRCVPRPMSAFAATVRIATFEYAPQGIEEPTVAVLTPGSLSETAFDQAYLASILGFPLVEAADLVVRDGAVYMRSLGTFKRLDVIIRRVDSDYSDPLDLRADSRLGVTGLVEAVSRGSVTVVNTLGSGVLENPALHTVLPALSKHFLGEDLLLNSVQTYWAGNDLERGKLSTDLPLLAITNFRTGEEFSGPSLSSAAIDTLRARIAAEPWQWVGRVLERYSVAPSSTPGPNGSRGTGSPLRAAPVGIRSFSVAQGSGYAVLPGGLGQVLAEGAAGSAMNAIAGKDVWVTTVEPAAGQTRVEESGGTPERNRPIIVSGTSPSAIRSSSDPVVSSPRVLSDLFWFGRYGERAELTTRMVKVARERYEDYRYRPWMTGTASIPLFLNAIASASGNRAVLQDTKGLLDFDSSKPPDPDEVLAATTRLHMMTSARRTPGSVAFAVHRLQQLARAIRDQLSTSTWMVLGSIDRALAELGTGPAAGAGEDTERDGSELGRAHDDILHGLLALAGLQAESMVHDPGWLFMDIGRRVERAQMLAGLTSAILVPQHDSDTEQGLLEAYLSASESVIIYRRRNRGIVRLGSVADLMLFDEGNPRAMIYQLQTLRHDLSSLPSIVRSAAAERIVEDLVGELRRVDPADLAAIGAGGERVELAELMRTLDKGLRELSDVLGRTRFAYPVDMQPLWGAGSEGS